MNVYDFDGTIFYSDSLADTPLALCAEKAHLTETYGCSDPYAVSEMEDVAVGQADCLTV